MSMCTSYVPTHIYIADMRTKVVRTKHFQLKSRLSMAFQPSADSFGIRRLGFKCSWWHWRQANDAVASERRIFSKNHDYKSFFRVAMNTYVPIFRDLDARGGRKIRTDTQAHTRDNYSNPRCAK